MKPLTFSGYKIEVIGKDGKFLFKTLDVARSVGYSSISGIEYHIKGTRRDVRVNGVQYVTKETIAFLAKKATRTPLLKQLSMLARQYVVIYQEEQKVLEAKAAKNPGKEIIKVLKQPQQAMEPCTITEAAKKLGMSGTDLNTFLVDEGFARRYTSNGAMHWTHWTKEQGLGCLRTIGEGLEKRTSNVPLITQKGFEWIMNRLSDRRATGVLMFAKQEATERETLENEIDELILDTFHPTLHTSGYTSAFGSDYRMDREELLKYTKRVIAQVKLKDKE